MLNHQGSPVLFTQRLRLRPYRAGDGAQMFSAWVPLPAPGAPKRIRFIKPPQFCKRMAAYSRKPL